MKLIKIILLAFGLSLLAACGQPTVDGSSDEATKKSIEKISKSLSEAEQKKFQEAVVMIAFNQAMSQMDMEKMMRGESPDVEAIQAQVRERLHGKNAQEIIAEGERIRAEVEKNAGH
ncbi:MAG: DUF6694 family lipoprotein [Azovibrio sp.]